MGQDELPRSAVSLVRELFEEVIEKYRGACVFIHMLGHEDLSEIDREVAEWRRRFKAIEDNLYSGPNSGR